MLTATKCLKQGVAIDDVYQTIQAFMGGLFVNYFNEFGRTWQGYVEAEAPYRSNTQDLGQFYVRNSQGQNVPLSALATSRPVTAGIHPALQRVPVGGDHRQRRAGYSSEQATAALEDVFKQTMRPRNGLRHIMGMSYQEAESRSRVLQWAIFGLSLLFVFLVLAALYESWSLPWSVLLSTPFAVFGALVALWLRRVVLGWFLPPYMVSDGERCIQPRLV